MKIKEFLEFHNITRMDLSNCIEIPRHKNEPEDKYRLRIYQRIRRREKSEWDMDYLDGVVTMRAPDGGEKRHNARKLDGLVKVD